MSGALLHTMDATIDVAKNVSFNYKGDKVRLAANTFLTLNGEGYIENEDWFVINQNETQLNLSGEKGILNKLEVDESSDSAVIRVTKNYTIRDLLLNKDTIIDIDSDTTLTIENTLDITNDVTLVLKGTGTLNLVESFRLYGKLGIEGDVTLKLPGNLDINGILELGDGAFEFPNE